MSARRPFLPRLVLAIAAAAVLAPHGVRAEGEPVDLPIEAELVARALALDLRGGEVEVWLDPDRAPSLLVTDLLRPDNAEGFVVVADTDGVLRLTQPHGDETVAPRLRVRIVAVPGTPISIEGERLNVTIRRIDAPPVESVGEPGSAGAAPERLPEPRAEAPPAAAQPVAPELRLNLSQSSVGIAGVGGQWKGRDTHFRVEGAQGPLAVDLDGGRLVLERFDGILDVRAADADVELHDLRATLSFWLDHGSLTADLGAGRASGTATASSIAFRRWYGGIAVQGDQNRVEFVQAGLREAQLACSGRANELQLEQIEAPLNVDLVQGRIFGRRLLAAATIRARDGAEVALELVKGRLALDLDERVRASVQGADDTADVRITASEATLTGLRHLDLRASASTITASEITGDARVRAGDSELDLDLRQVTQSPDLDLTGATTARVTFPSPCFLSTENADEVRERIELAGCEIYDGRQRLYAAPGKRVLLARTKVASGARLVARSSP